MLKSVNSAIIKWVNHPAKWWQFWYIESGLSFVSAIVYPLILALPVLVFSPKLYGCTAQWISFAWLIALVYSLTIALLAKAGVNNTWDLCIELLKAVAKEDERIGQVRARRRTFFARMKARFLPK